MADQVLILQVRDNTLTRRDIGVVTNTPGEYAARVKDPDAITALSAINTTAGGLLTNTQLRASAVPVSISGSIPVTGPLTDAQLRASAVPISGTVAISGSVTVTATNLDIRDLVFATDKVDASGSSVSISNFPATQPVSGTVAISQTGTDNNVDANITNASLAVTGPVTDAQLRATPIDVNLTTGDIEIGAVELKDATTANRAVISAAGALKIDGSGVTQPVSATNLDVRDLVFATDKVDASGSSVTVSNFPATVAVTQSTSPWVVGDGGGTLTVDNLVLTDVHDVGNSALNVNVVAGAASGLTDAQLRASPVPISGTVTIQDGGNVITVDAVNLDIRDLVFATDKVDISGSSVTVSNFPASQAVTGPLTDAQLRASAVPVSGPLTDAQLRATPVPVSGTVAVSSLSGTVTVVGKDADGAVPTGNPVLVGVFDATNVQQMAGDTTGNVGTYPKIISTALADTVSNTVRLPADVSGTVIGQRTFPAVYDGTQHVRLRGDTNGLWVGGNVAHDAVDAGNPIKVGGKARSAAPADVAASDRVDAYFDLKGRLKVDGSDVTQPVSGTVAATQSGTWNVGTVTPGTGATNLGKAEDAAHASGDVGVMALGVANEALVTYGADGDYTPVATDRSGRLFNIPRSTTSTLADGVANASVPHWADLAATAPVYNVTMPYAYNGATWDRQRGDAANGLDVDVTRLPAIPAGNNNIGDVDVASIAAGTNYIGVAGSRQRVGNMEDDDGTAVTVKPAHLDMTTATTTDIVAAVASKKIRVLQWGHSVNENIGTDVNFARGAGTTRVTGSKIVRMAGVAGDGGYRSEVAPTGGFLFETAAGEALRVTQTAAADLSTSVMYVEVD